MSDQNNLYIDEEKRKERVRQRIKDKQKKKPSIKENGKPSKKRISRSERLQ